MWASKFSRARCIVVVCLHSTVSLWLANNHNELAGIQIADNKLDQWQVNLPPA